MEDGDFWNDPVVSQNKMKTLKSMKDDVATYEKLATQFDDIETLIEMGYEENDASLIPEIEEMLSEFVTTFDNIRIKTLLSGEYDGDNAILSLHAGAGGTESCDWAQMLFRMYSKWADSRGYELVVLDSLDGDEAGIKSITFQINGENAYGYLKSEKGVHRLVRISPFNAAVPAEPVDSISTRLPLRSGSRTFRPELSCSARMSAPSTRTRIRQCRC